MIENELSEDEIKVLKDMVEREKAVSRVWGWVKNFLYVAVPVTTLYAFYQSMSGKN